MDPGQALDKPQMIEDISDLKAWKTISDFQRHYNSTTLTIALLYCCLEVLSKIDYYYHYFDLFCGDKTFKNIHNF